METIAIEEIKQGAVSGMFFLTIRNFGIQMVSTVGFFILTILLGRSEVGLFGIVTASIGILGYFSDIGLASALIQKKTDIDKKELQSTFTIQQILVIISLVAAVFVYQNVSRTKNFGSQEFWIMVSLCYSFAIASLKTIPSVLLERRLNFKKLSSVDIAENLTFYILAVLFAFLGFHGYSYAIAVVIKSTVGLILIYIYQQWPIGISFSFSSIKELFKFGIPFQLNSLIALAKDQLSNLLVASIIGVDGFGILSWAQKATRMPLTMMDSVMRVTFPAFSRLQERADLLSLTLKKSVYYIALLIFPTLTIVSLVAPDFINFVPKYTKWLPAVIPLYLFSVNAAIASITTPITNAFNAVGKITLTTKLMIMWTVLTWIFYPFLSYKYGYLGTAVATLLVGSSSFVVWFLSNKIFSVNVFSTILKPFLTTIVLFIFLLFINTLKLNYFFSIASKISFGYLIFFFLNYLLSPKEFKWLYLQIKCLIAKK